MPIAIQASALDAFGNASFGAFRVKGAASCAATPSSTFRPCRTKYAKGASCSRSGFLGRRPALPQLPVTWRSTARSVFAISRSPTLSLAKNQRKRIRLLARIPEGDGGQREHWAALNSGALPVASPTVMRARLVLPDVIEKPLEEILDFMRSSFNTQPMVAEDGFWFSGSLLGIWFFQVTGKKRKVFRRIDGVLDPGGHTPRRMYAMSRGAPGLGPFGPKFSGHSQTRPAARRPVDSRSAWQGAWACPLGRPGLTQGPGSISCRGVAFRAE